MKILFFFLLLALLVGGGGFYLGSPMFGGAAIGIILMVSLIFCFAGGFRTR
jgi:hypothetical protein